MEEDDTYIGDFLHVEVETDNPTDDNEVKIKEEADFETDESNDSNEDNDTTEDNIKKETVETDNVAVKKEINEEENTEKETEILPQENFKYSFLITFYCHKIFI